MILILILGHLVFGRHLRWGARRSLFGGLAIAGASNAFNQIIERDIDAVMKRTKNRPIPLGYMTPTTAFWIAVALSILGLAALYAINPKTSMFAAISMFLYSSVYTPLKTKTPLAVFVGAFEIACAANLLVLSSSSLLVQLLQLYRPAEIDR